MCVITFYMDHLIKVPLFQGELDHSLHLHVPSLTSTSKFQRVKVSGKGSVDRNISKIISFKT